MKTALVTGGYGYIGGYLVDALLRKGWRVHIVDTFFSAKRERFNGGHVNVHNAPVANADAVARALKGVSVVFHLASRCDRSDAPRHLLRLTKTNIEGTAVVLALAHACGVNNVVFASDAAVYGDLAGGLEADYVEPISAYGATKLAAEALCHYYNAIGLDVKILRLFNVWGRCGSESFVNQLAKGCRTVWGEGQHTRDYIYIDDAVNALVNAQAWEPGVYNVGTGEETSLLGLYRLLALEDEPQFAPEPVGTIYRSFAEMDATLARTGWQAKVKLSELTREEILRRCSIP